MTSSSRISMLNEWRAEDFNESDDWRKRGMESYRFYTGYRQWEQQDLDKLDAEGRPHLQINLTMPIVNTLVGIQAENKQDFKLFPRRGGSTAVAALGSELLKHTMDICDGESELSDVFLSGLISGMGVIGVKKQMLVDKINGELVLEYKSPFSVLFDQNATEYDFNKRGRRQFEGIWLTSDELEESYGVNVKDVSQAVESPKFASEKIELEDDDYGETGRVDKSRKDQYLVQECYWRKWQKNTYLVNLANWSTKLILSRSQINFVKGSVARHKAESAEAGIPPMWAVIERAGWLLHRTVFVGEMELEHTVDPWNRISDFPNIPFYPYWAHGYPMGVVDNLKAPQRELNKRVSQELHIINTTANTGWKIKDGKNIEAVRELKRDGGKSGFVLDESKFGGEAEKLKPNEMGSSIPYIAKQNEQYIDRISGVDPNLRGITDRKESGKALNMRMTATMSVVRGVFENFNRTQKSLARFLWDIIRQRDNEGESVVYSRKEIESIVQEASLREFIVDDGMGNQEIDLSPFYSEEIGHYGIKVATSPNTQTVRSENLDMLLQIAEKYPPAPDGSPIIPAEFLLELTDIPRRDELIESIRRKSQAMAQMAQGVPND